MDSLALHLDRVILADRESPDTCWLVHPHCAQTTADKINDQIGYERIYLYGPGSSDNGAIPCASCGL